MELLHSVMITPLNFIKNERNQKAIYKSLYIVLLFMSNDLYHMCDVDPLFRGQLYIIKPAPFTSSSKKKNLEEWNLDHKSCCHNLFTIKWGLVFWHLTSKPLDSISCRHWRKSQKDAKCKLCHQGQSYSPQDDREVDKLLLGDDLRCHLSLKSCSKH